MTNKVIIFTDGACSGNPGPGGWGAVMRYNGTEKELNGGTTNTTNNRMELTAAIEALNSLKRPCDIDLYTDSSYLRDGISKYIQTWKKNGWVTSNRKEVKNKDLWTKLDQAVSIHNIHWHWVKGHAGDEGNEKADKLAVDGMRPHLKDNSKKHEISEENFTLIAVENNQSQ